MSKVNHKKVYLAKMGQIFFNLALHFTISKFPLGFVIFRQKCTYVILLYNLKLPLIVMHNHSHVKRLVHVLCYDILGRYFGMKIMYTNFLFAVMPLLGGQGGL